MYPNSPLDTLTAFSIVFLFAVVSTAGLIFYINKLQQNHPQTNSFS